MSAAQTVDIGEPAQRSELYKALAFVFRYPHDGQHSVLSGAQFTQVFDPAVSKNAVSLREASYAKHVHPTALYEELLRFYAFFGLGRADQADMPDSLCVELEFMHFLAELEKNALASGESIEPIQRAQYDFLGRHLSVLAGGMRARGHREIPEAMEMIEACSDLVLNDLARLSERFGEYSQ